jgi:lipase chaperone LimK
MADEAGTITKPAKETREQKRADYAKEISKIHQNTELNEEQKQKEIQKLLAEAGLFEEKTE